MTGATPTPATRAEALRRLQAFLPDAGRRYAACRNYDRPGQGHPNVSRLSPFLRHRILAETEVLEAVLGRHSMASAEKFVQEVYWRTYWKGWLEMRPGVWADYRRDLERALSRMDADMAAAVSRAESGDTGLAPFDAWARELVDTGYLSNHARMWTASIWIFTLRLPWEVGADWFLRHLLDGDPASNTLGWRWVAGLQTRGKAYAARAENIARYTDGRFDPRGQLNETPEPLSGPAPPDRRPPPEGEDPAAGLRTGLLLTEEDLGPHFVLDRLDAPPVAHATLCSVDRRSPRAVSEAVTRFTRDAIADARGRWAARMGAAGPDTSEPRAIRDWAVGAGLEQLVTAHAPVGPTASALRGLDRLLGDAGIRLVRVLRPEDRAAWPFATHGFFRFKARIPELLTEHVRLGDRLQK
jgi:deoxyribodipyrimidine photo-lyase